MIILYFDTKSIVIKIRQKMEINITGSPLPLILHIGHRFPHVLTGEGNVVLPYDVRVSYPMTLRRKYY